jgi:hypothetical protein
MEKTVEQTEHIQESPEQMAPGEQVNPEVRAWFEKYPTVEAAVARPLDEKRQFILSYYSEDPDSEKMLEEMFEQAEKVLDKEIEAGKIKPPFSEALVTSMMVIAKGKVIDELIEEVSKLYQERRKLVKGKDIKDPGVIKITQINVSKLAYMLQSKILKQVEEEAKSRNIPLDDFMYICAMIAGNDMQTFIDIERIYNYRKTEESKDKEFDLEKVKEYIQESLKISEKILSGELDSTMVFLYPHLLSDKLYNLTGFESEEVISYIRKLAKSEKLGEDFANLIISEAYSVEKSRDNCQTTFDNHMMAYEKLMQEAYIRRQKELEEQSKDPLDDPAVKKMIQTGLLNRADAENIINRHAQSQGIAKH